MILRLACSEHYRTKNTNLRLWEDLSERQKEVAALATNSEIVTKLDISLGTVKTHIGDVLRKFDVRGRHQLRYFSDGGTSAITMMKIDPPDHHISRVCCEKRLPAAS